MKDLRTKIFFWIGVFILPPFWSWFTLRKSFSALERAIAFTWMLIFLALCLVQHDALHAFFTKFVLGFAFISAWMTLIFALWFFFRIKWLRNPIELLVLVDVIAMGMPQFIQKFDQLPTLVLFLTPLLPITLLILTDLPFSVGFNNTPKRPHSPGDPAS